MTAEKQQTSLEAYGKATFVWLLKLKFSCPFLK